MCWTVDRHSVLANLVKNAEPMCVRYSRRVIVPKCSPSAAPKHADSRTLWSAEGSLP